MCYAKGRVAATGLVKTVEAKRQIAECSLQRLNKMRICVSGDHYIKIVVPWDETSMTNASQQCAVLQKIRDFLPLADAVEHLQQLEVGIL